MASECLINFIWGKWEWEPDKEDYDSWYIDDQAVVWGWAKSWLFQTNENFDTCIVYFYLDLSWKPSVLLIFAKYLIIFYVTEYSVWLFCSALNSAFLVLYRNHYHSCFCGGFSLSLFFFFPSLPNELHCIWLLHFCQVHWSLLWSEEFVSWCYERR